LLKWANQSGFTVGEIMNTAPKWFLPVAVIALLWNLLGCVAYLGDALMTPEDVAGLDAAQQALRAERPAWSVAATAVAVWAGAAGCLGLILRRRWATPLLIASLIAVIVQDFSLFILGSAGNDPVVLSMQGLVLLIAIGLVVLARRASRLGWLR
jgi:hypothetical protein